MENSPSEDSKKGEITSGRRTRSQTLAVRKEPEAVRPKKTLNFLSKKSRVYGKNYVKKSKKRKRLRNSSNVGVVYSKRRKVYDEEKEKSSDEDLKIGEFYVRPNKRYNPRVGAHTNVDAVNLLNEKLDAKQIQMFRETCFGHFLDLPPVVVQHQLIHHLLLREVVEEEEDALWISINGVGLRFGLFEFAIITGLKCTGDTDKLYDSDGTDRLVDTYFSDCSQLTKVPKQSIIDCFINKRWKSDEDAVKIAVLYFIHTFLFSTVNRKHISREEIELVESGAYETYPWGEVVFKATLESMKGKLRGKPSMYRLGGLPLAFQCWFYECCPYVINKVAFRVDDRVPRILSWKVTKQPTFKELWHGIFKKRRDAQLKLRNISPTEFEQTTLALPELVESERVNELKLRNISPTEFEQTTLALPEPVESERVNEVASGDGAEVHLSDEDLSNLLPLASWKLPKKKPKPPLSNVDWRTEFKRLSDGQSELKSEIQMLNKEFASLKDCMGTSFANIFKAIESLSKKQGDKAASELDEGNDPHDRHVDSDSSEFSISEGQDHGKDSMGDEDNNEKANEGAMGAIEKANEGAMCDIENMNEGALDDKDNNNEKANEGATCDIENANEGALDEKENNNEKANEGALGDVEKANECAFGDKDNNEKANEGAFGDKDNNEKADEGAMGDAEKANEGAFGDKDNNMKANEGTMGDVEGAETLGDPMEEVERMDISESQILPDTCEVSDHVTPEQLTKPSHSAPVPENQGENGVEDSSKKSSNVVDNVDYSLLTEFDKWVDEGMKKQSK